MELAGADYGHGSLLINPVFIRGMANWVLEQCVRGSDRLGGFVTARLDNYRNWLFVQALVDTPGQSLPAFRELANLFGPPLNFHLYANPLLCLGAFSSAFITVTVSRPWENIKSPGNYDPSIPFALFRTAQQAAVEQPLGSEFRSIYQDLANSLTLRALETRRGGDHKWTQYPSGSDTMAYECDTKLGAPRPVDCARIAYSQLGFSSDTLSVRPGVDKFFSLSE